jgi:hypothetical protein
MRFVDLIEVRHYDYAHWRRAIGSAPMVDTGPTRVELYERVAERQTYVYDNEQKKMRVG